jgi:hypothetical protein
MANEIVPYNMTKALREIDRLRALIAWRCTRDEIRDITVPLKKDIADPAARRNRLLHSGKAFFERLAPLRRVDALDHAFQTEGKRSNGTGPVYRKAARAMNLPRY